MESDAIEIDVIETVTVTETDSVSVSETEIAVVAVVDVFDVVVGLWHPARQRNETVVGQQDHHPMTVER